MQFTCPAKHFEVKSFLVTFEDKEKNYRPSGKVFSAWFSKLQSMCPKELFEEKYAFEKKMFLRKKCFWEKNVFEKKYVFEKTDKDWKKFRHTAGVFKRSCHNSFLSVQWYILSRNKHFEKLIIFFIFFGYWAKYIRLSVEMYLN